MKKSTNTNNILDHNNDNKYDIIIIGAGVSSLAAIQEIHMFNNNSKSKLKRPIKYLILEVDNKASNIDVKKKQAPRKAVNFVIKLAVPLAVIKPPPEPPEPPIPSPPPSLF